MPQQAPISFQIRTKNVLIIDANEAMQKVRAKVLRSRGVHVHTAKSVTEAELLWVPDFFDLVLLDVRQRSKEAVEFWRTIRRQHPRQRIRLRVHPQVGQQFVQRNGRGVRGRQDGGPVFKDSRSHLAASEVVPT